MRKEFFNPGREAILQARREAAFSGRAAIRRADAETGGQGPANQGDALVEVSGTTTIRFTADWSLVDSTTELVG